MKLNKENLLTYYNIKKEGIEIMKTKTTNLVAIEGFDNQLYIIKMFVKELEYFD